MISRRRATQLMLYAPFFTPVMRTAARSQSARGAGAAVGEKQDAFDATFGTGEEHGSFTVYDFSAEGMAAYWVAWDTHGYAHQIANDYAAIAGGGLAFEPGLLGQSQFLPNDATIDAAGDLTNLQVGNSGFYVAQHHSERVRNRTGRSGNILVVDQRAIPGDGPNNPNFTQTSVAMESFEVHPVVPTGQLPTIESDWQQWRAVFGESWGTQRGTMPIYPPIPGRWMFHGTAIDVILDEGIPAADAAQWVSDFLPTELGEMTTTYWLPAPGGQHGLRVCIWTAGDGMSTVALQVVHGGEESGFVDRWVINTIAPATV